MTNAIQVLDCIVEEFVLRGHFRPVEVDLDAMETRLLVRFNGNPMRFLPKIFDGDWELLGVHPQPGSARVLRVVRDAQEVPRVILRQGPGLFIYTGVPLEPRSSEP